MGSPTHSTLLSSLYEVHKWEPYEGARDDLLEERKNKIEGETVK